MPEPPEGERQLRDLADRYARTEGQILGLLTEAPAGDRRALLIQALELLIAVRRLDHRAPVQHAYLAEYPEGKSGAVDDLARSLQRRLYRGAVTAADGSRSAFASVTSTNLDEMAPTAVLAAVDRRGTRWPLGAWAAMNATTLGRQATSRGISDRVGEGGKVTVIVGQCEWCQSHAGDAVIGTDALPPYHPSCSCVATAP